MIQGKYELPLLLIRTAMAGEPVGYTGKVDWDFLLDFGQKQDILPILLRGTRRLGLNIPEKVEKTFIKADDLAQAIEAAQFVTMKRMFSIFERQSFECVLLKGSLLRDLYPSPHLRTMGDIDILTVPFNPGENRLIMKELGLEPADKAIRDMSEYDVTTDNYTIPPFVQVEIHKRLSPIPCCPQMDNELLEMLGRVVPLPGYGHIRRLAIEDELMYLLIHLHKHYVSSGMGVRMLLDVWLFCGANQAALEQSSVESRLVHMGIWEFSQQIFRLCRVFFTQEAGEISPAEERLFLSGRLHYDNPMLAAGFKQFKGQSKLSLFLHIVLINRQRLTNYFPQLAEQPWLYPYYYAKRAIFVLRCRRSHLRQLFLFAFTKKGDKLFCEMRERSGK